MTPVSKTAPTFHQQYLIPHSEEYKKVQRKHRVRFLQLNLLAKEQKKSLAGIFSEKSSKMFQDTIKKEILDKFVVEGELAEDYTAENLIEDFRNIWKDVTDTCAKPPSKKRLQSMLPSFPSSLTEAIQATFDADTKAYNDMLEASVRKRDSDEEEYATRKSKKVTKKIPPRDIRMSM